MKKKKRNWKKRPLSEIVEEFEKTKKEKENQEKKKEQASEVVEEIKKPAEETKEQKEQASKVAEEIKKTKKEIEKIQYEIDKRKSQIDEIEEIEKSSSKLEELKLKMEETDAEIEEKLGEAAKFYHRDHKYVRGVWEIIQEAYKGNPNLSKLCQIQELIETDKKVKTNKDFMESLFTASYDFEQLNKLFAQAYEDKTESSYSQFGQLNLGDKDIRSFQKSNFLDLRNGFPIGLSGDFGNNFIKFVTVDRKLTSILEAVVNSLKQKLKIAKKDKVFIRKQQEKQDMTSTNPKVLFWLRTNDQPIDMSNKQSLSTQLYSPHKKIEDLTDEIIDITENLRKIPNRMVGMYRILKEKNSILNSVDEIFTKYRFFSQLIGYQLAQPKQNQDLSLNLGFFKTEEDEQKKKHIVVNVQTKGEDKNLTLTERNDTYRVALAVILNRDLVSESGSALFLEEKKLKREELEGMASILSISLRKASNALDLLTTKETFEELAMSKGKFPVFEKLSSEKSAETEAPSATKEKKTALIFNAQDMSNFLENFDEYIQPAAEKISKIKEQINKLIEKIGARELLYKRAEKIGINKLFDEIIEKCAQEYLSAKSAVESEQGEQASDETQKTNPFGKTEQEKKPDDKTEEPVVKTEFVKKGREHRNATNPFGETAATVQPAGNPFGKTEPEKKPEAENSSMFQESMKYWHGEGYRTVQEDAEDKQKNFKLIAVSSGKEPSKPGETEQTQTVSVQPTGNPKTFQETSTTSMYTNIMPSTAGNPPLNTTEQTEENTPTEDQTRTVRNSVTNSDPIDDIDLSSSASNSDAEDSDTDDGEAETSNRANLENILLKQYGVASAEKSKPAQPAEQQKEKKKGNSSVLDRVKSVNKQPVSDLFSAIRATRTESDTEKDDSEQKETTASETELSTENQPEKSAVTENTLAENLSETIEDVRKPQIPTTVPPAPEQPPVVTGATAVKSGKIPPAPKQPPVVTGATAAKSGNTLPAAAEKKASPETTKSSAEKPSMQDLIKGFDRGKLKKVSEIKQNQSEQKTNTTTKQNQGLAEILGKALDNALNRADASQSGTGKSKADRQGTGNDSDSDSEESRKQNNNGDHCSDSEWD